MMLEKSPRYSRIVSTLGPASDRPQILQAIIRAGMNVARLNFSHGTHQSHQKTFNRLRDACRSIGREVAVMQDLQGHKVRVGNVVSGDGLRLALGQIIRLGTGDSVTPERIAKQLHRLYAAES